MRQRLIFALWLWSFRAAVTAAEEPAQTVLIHVQNLPVSSRFIVLDKEINFTDLLKQAGITGAADLATLHLERGDHEVPCQFTHFDQARLSPRPLLPSTPSSVSFAGEFTPTNIPERFQARGLLTWTTSTSTDETAQDFLLHFVVRKTGRLVQLPYGAQELQYFTDSGEPTPRPFAVMQIHPQWPADGKVNLNHFPKPIATYFLGPTNAESTFRRPFLHPIIGLGGVDLTEFGKPHDPTGSHAHHYGLWIAHNSVNGLDFWSEKGGQIRHERLLALEDGPVFCRVKQDLRWMHDNKTVMKETRTLTAYNSPGTATILDFDLQFSPAANEPVILGKTSFGFLAVRVAQSMSVFDGGGRILNSRGEINEQNAHLKHADWMDQSGPASFNRWSGITIFDSPQNPHHPSGWHCRNDGWACASFNMEEPYEIAPGKSLTLHYRVLAHSGNAQQADLPSFYNGYQPTPEILMSTLNK